MTTEIDLLRAAVEAAAQFRASDDFGTLDFSDLVRAADAYQADPSHSSCLLCTVRTLTEGEPTIWHPSEPASVKGVVLKTGHKVTNFSILLDQAVPYVDLWLGGTDRVRVMGYGGTLRNLFMDTNPQVGDTVTVAYTGQGTIERGKFAGKPYRMHTVEVERGHH